VANNQESILFVFVKKQKYLWLLFLLKFNDFFLSYEIFIKFINHCIKKIPLLFSFISWMNGFESHLQPFLLIYPEADLSLWCPIFYFKLYCSGIVLFS